VDALARPLVTPEGGRTSAPGFVWQRLLPAVARAQAQLERNAKFRPRGSSGRLPKAHLFVRGALRCGRCGGAMLPRSIGDREWYVCRTRADTHGPEACPMPVLDRAAVDSLALEMFQARCLDVDATKARLEAQLDDRIGIAGAEAERAAREALRAQEALDKADRDYREGELGPRAYSRQVESQGAALEAAEAEHERLSAQAEQITAAAAAWTRNRRRCGGWPNCATPSPSAWPAPAGHPPDGARRSGPGSEGRKQCDRHPGARPDQDEQCVERVDGRATHARRR